MHIEKETFKKLIIKVKKAKVHSPKSLQKLTFSLPDAASVKAHGRSAEIRGAYHLAKKSGNFGLRSNGKAIFRKIFSEIVDNLQR